MSVNAPCRHLNQKGFLAPPQGSRFRILLVAVLAPLLLAACDRRENKSNPPDYAISFDTQASCIDAAATFSPAWECYEITIHQVDLSTPVVLTHESGTTHKTYPFVDEGQYKVRFTPDLQGVWTIPSGNTIEINAPAPAYAKGFVVAKGQKWSRSASGEVFSPQYAMLEQGNLDDAIEAFAVGRAFTGFHITHLRDFLDNPAYFETIVLKTYRAGGATHFWIWGDAERKQTPTTYGISPTELYQALRARLSPIPGWTVSFGFDLHEWADAKTVEAFRAMLHGDSSYRPMTGARGHKNRYVPISNELDFASWEWHRPGFDDYTEHFRHAAGQPVFSEDRFRIRQDPRYADKDFVPERMVYTLWNSLLAGGAANIWGYKPVDGYYGMAFPTQQQMSTFGAFVQRFFSDSATPDTHLWPEHACMSDQRTAFCKVHAGANLTLTLPAQVNGLSGLDINRPFQLVQLPLVGRQAQLPYAGDWIVLMHHLANAASRGTNAH